MGVTDTKKAQFGERIGPFETNDAESVNWQIIQQSRFAEPCGR
jgi:hypothetical protein